MKQTVEQKIDKRVKEASEFIDNFLAMQKKNYSEKEIADFYGMTIDELRMRKRRYLILVRSDRIIRAKKMQRSGMSVTEIAKKLGLQESSVRLLLDENEQKAIADRQELVNYDIFKV